MFITLNLESKICSFSDIISHLRPLLVSHGHSSPFGLVVSQLNQTFLWKCLLLCSPDEIFCGFVSVFSGTYWIHSRMSQAWCFFKHSIDLLLNFLMRNSAAEDTVTSLGLKLFCWSFFLPNNWWEEHVFSALVNSHLRLCLMLAYYCRVTALNSETLILIYRLCNCALSNNCLPSYCREKN